MKRRWPTDADIWRRERDAEDDQKLEREAEQAQTVETVYEHDPALCPSATDVEADRYFHERGR